MDTQEKEELYLKAKEAYYSGIPIMSDYDFDILEDELRDLGSKVINIVGSEFKGLRKKIKLLSPMLSLNKIKSGENNTCPTEEILSWMKKTNAKHFEFTPKYDGNSAVVLYKNGIYYNALTRGNGKEGSDITEKLKFMVPETINNNSVLNNSLVEIRGEVLISKETFYSKYAKDFKNPRNFVAGVLNNKDINLEVINDLEFVPYDVRVYDDKGNFRFVEMVTFFLSQNNFKHFPNDSQFDLSKDNVEDFYKEYLNNRESSRYQLDGIVIKVLEDSYRKILGENEHDPEWARAIKFSPKPAETYIIDISWQMGKTGELTPVAILDPVDLDGSVVSRCSLYNWKNVVDNKLYPGAKIVIAKSGDIIPQVQKILEQSSIEYEMIDECPHCGSTLINDGVRIMCKNERCSGIKLFKFLNGVNILGFDFFGHKTIEKIFYAGIEDPLELLDSSKFNESFLIDNGLFKEGKSIDRLMFQIKNKTSIKLAEVIIMMSIDGLGKTVSKELAKMISGKSYSTYSLEKKFFEMFENGSYFRNLLNMKLEYLSNLNINVIEEIEENKNMKTFEMTGAPPKDKWKVKEEFVKEVEQFGFKHTSLNKDTNYLITDSHSSSSGKMGKAKKLNIPIFTYEEFFEEFLNK